MREYKGWTLVAEPVPTTAKKCALLTFLYIIRSPTVNYFFTHRYHINPILVIIHLGYRN
jgi:hypothetical protein